MKKLKSYIVRFYRIRGLKYGVVAMIAIVFIGFVDENSVWRHFCNQQKISALQEEIDMNLTRCRRDQAQIRLLESDPKAIEKIARERYFMKADDEDIFVLSDDEQPYSQPAANETAE